MKSDWAILAACETSASIPQELTEDLLVTMDGPTRLMMLLCERSSICEHAGPSSQYFADNGSNAARLQNH